MSNMMIGMVPVNGPLYSGDLFCEQHELMRCAHGQFGSGCAKMHRVRQSARARCWADAQGWLCPRLQLCTLNHLHDVNLSRVPWVYDACQITMGLRFSFYNGIVTFFFDIVENGVGPFLLF